MPTEPPNPGEPERISPVDLLPPADVSVRRQRRAERDAASRGRGGRHRTWPQRIVLSVMALAVLAAAGGAALAAVGLEKLERVERVGVALQESPPGEPENFLIVGSDDRDGLEGSGLSEGGFTGDGAEGSGQRSDTIVVARVDPAAETIDLLSLPRDLWLPIAGTGGRQRINTAYAGGPQRLIDTIEVNFDIPIHHYVEVDFAGFAGLVDAVGGVPVWFDAPMRDDHSGLRIESSGCHVLDPEMSLAFVRARHLEYRTDDGWSVDGTGDLGRITRQQVFLRRAAGQVADLGITDAVTLNRVLDVAVDNVSIDRRLGLEDMLDLGRRFADFDTQRMRTHALPVEDFTTSGGAAVLEVREAEAQPVLNVFRGLPADAILPAAVDDVTVLNGTGVAGQAGDVADALEDVGFGIAEVGDVEDGETVLRTRIRYSPGAERDADLLRRHLTNGADLVADEDLEDGELVLETGQDLTTIGRRPFPADDPIPTTTTTVDGATSSSSTSTSDAPTTTTTEPIGVAPDPSAAC